MQYPYTADLMCLDFCRPSSPEFPQPLGIVSSPLKVQSWEAILRPHPDKAFSQYLLRGIREGFRIGFNRNSPLKSASQNMQSARDHPEVIQQYIDNECSLGRMMGPFGAQEAAAFTNYHVSRFGVIPKGHNTGKWRLITDLSFPPGESVNDGVDPALCSLSYTTVEQVAEVAACLGNGALLAKIDIESAYRLVPVHPSDRPLQAVCWKGGIYFALMLPFGLRSAPKIFNAVADALEWHLRQQGVTHVFHYLDDFIVLGAPGASQCVDAMAVLNKECTFLGVPIAKHKSVGPTTCLTYLGIELDTVASQLRLPEDKLSRLQALLGEWGDRKACQRKELESLIGLLNHACKVVRAGRSFLRRMIDLLHSTPRSRRRHTPIRLNREFRSDLAWWRMFVARWNGVSFLPPARRLVQVEMASDASGAWGCGASHEKQWFQLRWNDRSVALPIVVKEFLPIILAAELWAGSWSERMVVCHCDNQAVVACLRSRTSKNRQLLHMLRVLAFVEACYHFHFYPVYIDTKANHLADDLSRNNAISFLSKVPEANKCQDQVSHRLLHLLLNTDLDWVSPEWQSQFSGIFRPDWQQTHTESTAQQ